MYKQTEEIMITKVIPTAIPNAAKEVMQWMLCIYKTNFKWNLCVPIPIMHHRLPNPKEKRQQWIFTFSTQKKQTVVLIFDDAIANLWLPRTTPTWNCSTSIPSIHPYEVSPDLLNLWLHSMFISPLELSWEIRWCTTATQSEVDLSKKVQVMQTPVEVDWISYSIIIPRLLSGVSVEKVHLHTWTSHNVACTCAYFVAFVRPCTLSVVR